MTNKLTAREFRRRVDALGIKSRALPAAYNVIHDGAGIREQARECGVNPSVLLRLVRQIRSTRVCTHCGSPYREPS